MSTSLPASLDSADTSPAGRPPARAGTRVAALTLATFTVGLAEYVLMGQLDIVAEGLGTSEPLAGQLVTVFALTYGLVTPLLVAALSRRSRRSILLASLLVFAAANMFSFFLTELWAFAAVRVVMAVAAGLIVVTSIASVGRLVPAGKTGRGIATVQMGFTAALILGVPLGRVLAEAVGWRMVFPVLAVLALASAVLIRLALPVLPGRAEARRGSQLALLGDRRILLGLLVTFLWLGGYSIAYTYLTPYLTDAVGAAGSAVTLVLFLFGLASLVGTQLGGRHADRHGHHRTLTAGAAIHVVILLALPLLTGALWASAVLLVLWSVSAWSGAAPQQIRVANLAPASGDVLIGLNQSTMQLAIAAGAAVGGVLIPLVGVQGLPWAAAVAVLASLLLLLGTARKQRV